jgi:hypothetical protein
LGYFNQSRLQETHMILGCTRTCLSSFKAVRVATVIALLVATGCVDRRFIVESNVPNSQVYIDNHSVGPAPAYSSFDYYGYYNFTIVHPGYETLNERVHVMAPWYAYPPFDFVVEALWPFHIRDKRRYYFELHEITKPRVDDLVRNAESLRQRASELPIPEHPAPPKTPANPPVQPQTAPVVTPVGPQTGPIIPQVGPQNGPILPPAGPQNGPLIPNVGPPSDSAIPSVLPPVQ